MSESELGDVAVATGSEPDTHGASGADIVLTEIIRNGVLAVTEEMKTNLMRTAYNMIIYEALDFTVGLFTAKGETISIGLGLPMFIRGMSETIKAKIKRYEPDGVHPGDILVTNDAYLTGSHLNHFTFSLPIFHEGKLAAWSCCMAHWPDVGGALGTLSTDIFAEGIQIPIVKYQRAGVVNDELIDIIRTNLRLPDRAMGDLRAQITAIKTGERRFLELLDRYGQRQVLNSISLIMDQSERAARARTRAIADGIYEAESFMDDDGIDIGTRIPIKVRIIKEGDELTVDLTEVGTQVRGFYNSGVATGFACAQVAYKCLTSPTDYPINEGSFRSLKVKFVEGTVVTAVKPAAMRWWMTYPMTVVDTLLKAMSKALPEGTIAGHHADLGIALMHGISPRDGKLFISSVGPAGGGWGATHNADGVSATVCLNDGDTHKPPIEQMEAKMPIMYERHSLRPDSGGAGRFRGGLGTEQIVQARAPFNFSIQVERVHCRPWGLDGGLSGVGNQVALRTNGTVKEDYPNAKLVAQRLKTGDAFIIRTAGGGGFGPPGERDPQRVANDVRQGYVSIENARDLYGVVLDANGQPDQEQTRILRATHPQTATQAD